MHNPTLMKYLLHDPSPTGSFLSGPPASCLLTILVFFSKERFIPDHHPVTALPVFIIL